MEDEYYSIKWSAALTPDPSMIPDSSVFSQAAPGCSLTETIEEYTSALSNPGNTSEDEDIFLLAEKSSSRMPQFISPATGADLSQKPLFSWRDACSRRRLLFLKQSKKQDF
jgi:hypothetical protein